MPRSLAWLDVTARRMARSLLAESSPNITAPAVARALCGVHAQILQAAELSIGRRNGSTRSEVQQALWVDRTLVKTFGPRGTVHLLATADLPMWTGALSALPSTALRWEANQAMSARLMKPGRNPNISP